MDYYIVVNGQKQGPFDVLSLIKKVKNGTVSAQTQVSKAEDGPYRPAGEVEELKSILKAESGQRAVLHSEIKLSLATVLNESAELWIRRVVEYTMFFGVIVLAGFGISTALKKIHLFADYSYITTYIVSTVTFTLIGLFDYYVLITKRSQAADAKEVKALVRFSLLPLLAFSGVVALATIFLGISPLISLIILVALALVLSALIFVPFLITDHRMGLKRAIAASLEGFKSLDISLKVVVFITITVNFAAVLVPQIIHSEILLLGLVVILPVSVAVIAHIYDHVLA